MCVYVCVCVCVCVSKKSDLRFLSGPHVRLLYEENVSIYPCLGKRYPYMHAQESMEGDINLTIHKKH